MSGLQVSVVLLFRSLSADQRNITAEPGDNVILPCRAPDNNPVVEWIRTDLDSGFVRLFKVPQLRPDFQHPSFENRVDLLDSQMKDGDVSLVLKNVNTDDVGTYECFYRRLNQRKTAYLKTDPISIIHLDVAPPQGNQDGGNVHRRFGLIAPVIPSLMLMLGLLCWKIKSLNKNTKCVTEDVLI